MYICGCRGAVSVSGDSYREFGCATTCYVIKHGGHAVVIDCGSGLFSAKELLSDCGSVDVFLTHLHYDHIIGLLCGDVFPPEGKIRFFLPDCEDGGKNALERFMSPPFWPYSELPGELVALTPPCSLSLRGGIRADVFPSCHPNGGMLVRLGTDKTSICFSFDYEHGTLSLDNWIADCDWLVYDGMYSSDEYGAHEGWGHSTWEEGCRLAAENRVLNLLITHHAPQHTDEMLRQRELEAQKLFDRVRFAREGDVFILEENL